MSAISAVWVRADGIALEPFRAAFKAALTRFGPDRQSTISSGAVTLGCYVRQSLPEDRFDRQPLQSQDGSTFLVADVRLDNRSDLARELELTQPEQLADSEILMGAWQRWGSACLDRVIGAFAFATWTPSRQELFAARDHTGQRPLFYTRSQEYFALSSMSSGLLALPGVSHAPNEARIAEWLTSLKSDRSSSFFETIQVLPAGHFVRVTPGQFECKQYWHPEDAASISFNKDADYAEALRETLDRAVEVRLRSAKPIGSLLSAGLDSGGVTSSAALLLGSKGKRLAAFTSVPRPEFHGNRLPGRIPDETQGAADVCRLYPNIDHILVDSRGKDLLATMKSWIEVQNEPPGNAVNKLWFSAVMQRARQQSISVLLEAACGNATISWSTWSILEDLFRRGRWVHLMRTVRSLRAHDALSIKTALRYSMRGLIPEWLIRRLVSQGPLVAMPTELINDEWMRRFNLQERIFDSIYSGSANGRENQAQLFEQYDEGSLHLANEALTGIELRDPTADKRIYEFCFGIPQEQYLAEGHSRSLIRRATQDRLPDSVRLSYIRGLQSADWYFPVAEALFRLRRDIEMFRQSPAVSSALNVDAMQRLLDEWPQSGLDTPEVYARWHAGLTYALSAAYFLLANE